MPIGIFRRCSYDSQHQPNTEFSYQLPKSMATAFLRPDLDGRPRLEASLHGIWVDK
jgi:hypothetical protein